MGEVIVALDVAVVVVAVLRRPPHSPLRFAVAVTCMCVCVCTECVVFATQGMNCDFWLRSGTHEKRLFL